MAKIKPFAGLRPTAELLTKIVTHPYDVINSEEARAEALNNDLSYYHIIKPEIDFDSKTDEHDSCVYDKCVENFKKFQENGWLTPDNQEMYYLYAQKMNGRTQYGLVVCANVQDYFNEVIKKHELTRSEKEEDRMKHIRNTNANLEPVFLAYPSNDVLNMLVDEVITAKPVYEFEAYGNVEHTFWLINDKTKIDEITKIFSNIPYLYIADGHHRTAAAARVGLEMAKNNPHHTGNEEYNYFLAVCFPDEQLKIFDYNRLVKDLNGLTDDDFLCKLSEYFIVSEVGSEIYKPTSLHNFGMYLSNKWYSLTAKPEICNDDDPIGVLDVTLSSEFILKRILNIVDLRVDKRIDFVGGIRGLEELQKRVDSGEMKMALALYSVTMSQLINIADSGEIMPPKTTWFEPKLLSGLIVHKLV